MSQIQNAEVDRGHTEEVTIYFSTVKPAHVAISIKQSHFSCPVIENFIGIEPLLRGPLFYKTTISLSLRFNCMYIKIP